MWRSWSWLVLWRSIRTSRTNTKNRCPFHHRGLECKSRKSRGNQNSRQVWSWSTKWSRAKANRVLTREHAGHIVNMVFHTLFNLSLNFAIRSWWSEPQSVPGYVFADCIELLHLHCKKYNQSHCGIDHLVMSMCTDIFYLVGRGCLPWPVHSLGKAISLCPASFCTPSQICLLLQVPLDFLLLHSSPL